MTDDIFTNSGVVPLRTRAEAEAICAEVGLPQTVAAALPELVLQMVAETHAQLQQSVSENDILHAELREARSDVTRLRGQRDALRATLMARQMDDPMMGYASGPTLAAIQPPSV